MKNIVLFVCCILNVAVFAQSGSLDNTFGIGGKVITDFGGFYGDYGQSVAIQNDEKIVVAGYKGNCIGGSSCFNSFALARYNGDGTLDNTFGSGGTVTTSVGNAIIDSKARSVAIQGDGKIVAAGYCDNGVYPYYSEYDFALVRYNSDGSLDNSFGSGGKVTTDIRDYDFGFSVAIQSDGKILVAGNSLIGNNTVTDDFTLVRYNTDGTLDTAFGSNGIVITSVGSYDDEANSVIIQNDGKIVVSGGNGNGTGHHNLVALVRYNNDGSLDSSFGIGGKVLTNFGHYDDMSNSIVIRNDGKIIVAGQSFNFGFNHTDFALVRYNSDGSLDSSFGSGGEILTDFGNSYDLGFSIKIQSDDKMVVAGWSRVGGINEDFALVRYNCDGSLDNSFDFDGKVTTAIGDSTDAGNSLAIQGDGKIVVAGYSYNDTTGYDFAIARYTSKNILTELGDEVNVSKEKEPEIYPNPTSGIFTVNLHYCREVKICIYDVLGKCLWNKDYRNDASPKIDLSSQVKGIYFMEIVSDGTKTVNKIVLQ